MKSFAQFITEGRDAPIYHGTSVENLVGILSSDTLRVNRWYQNISFSRDPKHASFMARFQEGKADALLVFDQRKLSHNFKMAPFNQWTDTSGTNRYPMHQFADVGEEGMGRNEFEERIFRDIPKVSRYLLEIAVLNKDVGKLPPEIRNHDKLAIVRDWTSYRFFP